MVGWHHRLNGHEFEQAPRDGEGQGSLECCSPWDYKESDTTEWLNNNKPGFQNPLSPTQSPGLPVHPHSTLILPRCRSPVDPPRSAPPSAEKVSPDSRVVRTARGSWGGGSPEGRGPRVGGQWTVSGAILRIASSVFRERRPAPPGVLQAAAGGWEETK